MSDRPWAGRVRADARSLGLAMMLGAVVGVGPVRAQSVDLLTGAPDGWVVLQDRENGGDAPRITPRNEGLDVLTGASAILYSPGASASGNYRVELDVTQFDPGGRNEGFGLIFGGTELASAARSYAYFLIRQDGQYLLKRREGDRTFLVRDWSSHPAIHRWAARKAGSDGISQRIALEVRPNDLRMFVNGELLIRLEDSRLQAAGTLGLRVNHGLRLQVNRFALTALDSVTWHTERR